MTGDDTGVAAAVSANYDGQRRAMVAGDAEALGELLAGDFTLVHMTGYRQPRAEWLADVRSGAMTYHSMEDESLEQTPDGYRAMDERTALKVLVQP